MSRLKLLLICSYFTGMAGACEEAPEDNSPFDETRTAFLPERHWLIPPDYSANGTCTIRNAATGEELRTIEYSNGLVVESVEADGVQLQFGHDLDADGRVVRYDAWNSVSETFSKMTIDWSGLPREIRTLETNDARDITSEFETRLLYDEYGRLSQVLGTYWYMGSTEFVGKSSDRVFYPDSVSVCPTEVYSSGLQAADTFTDWMDPEFDRPAFTYSCENGSPATRFETERNATESYQYDAFGNMVGLSTASNEFTYEYIGAFRNAVCRLPTPEDLPY